MLRVAQLMPSTVRQAPESSHAEGGSKKPSWPISEEFLGGATGPPGTPRDYEVPYMQIGDMRPTYEKALVRCEICLLGGSGRPERALEV